MSYNSLAQKVLPRHNLVRFYFFAQKGVYNFQNSKKKADQINSIVLRIPKRLNIFEIGSLEVLPRVYTVLRPYMYIDIYFFWLFSISTPALSIGIDGIIVWKQN